MKLNHAKQKILILSILAGGLLLVTSTAYAYSGWGGPGPEGKKFSEEEMKEREARFEQLVEELNLNAEQTAALKEHRAAGKGNRGAFRKSMQANKQAMQKLMASGDASDEEVERLIEESGELHKQKMWQHVEKIRSMREILTPEQFARLQEKHDELREQRGRHRGKRFKRKDKEPSLI